MLPAGNIGSLQSGAAISNSNRQIAGIPTKTINKRMEGSYEYSLTQKQKLILYRLISISSKTVYNTKIMVRAVEYMMHDGKVKEGTTTLVSLLQLLSKMLSQARNCSCSELGSNLPNRVRQPQMQ